MVFSHKTGCIVSSASLQLYENQIIKILLVVLSKFKVNLFSSTGDFGTVQISVMIPVKHSNSPNNSHAVELFGELLCLTGLITEIYKHATGCIP
jgi:hypothetical protein